MKIAHQAQKVVMVPKVESEEKFVVELTRSEAMCLVHVMGNIGGTGSGREICGEFWRGLRDKTGKVESYSGHTFHGSWH